jgi:hypothetical protein
MIEQNLSGKIYDLGIEFGRPRLRWFGMRHQRLKAAYGRPIPNQLIELGPTHTQLLHERRGVVTARKKIVDCPQAP